MSAAQHVHAVQHVHNSGTACSLVKQLSKSGSKCLLNQTFGCSADFSTMWTSSGCGGAFQCGSRKVVCGKYSQRERTECLNRCDGAAPIASCKLLKQTSKATRCTLNQTFGCADDLSTMWTSSSCAGVFLCNSRRIACGEKKVVQRKDCVHRCEGAIPSPSPPPPPPPAWTSGAERAAFYCEAARTLATRASWLRAELGQQGVDSERSIEYAGNADALRAVLLARCLRPGTSGEVLSVRIRGSSLPQPSTVRAIHSLPQLEPTTAFHRSSLP